MAARECYHCKQLIQPGEAHDCWTTTEAALTADLSEDLRDAWERLRETAVEFGEQRIYASHSSIMFARKSCYFFVRPKKNFLELCFFVGRTVTAPQIKRAEATSRTRVYHLVQIRHRDQVEAPLTDWLREAYDHQDAPKPAAPPKKTPPKKSASKTANKATNKKTSKTNKTNKTNKKTRPKAAGRKSRGR